MGAEGRGNCKKNNKIYIFLNFFSRPLPAPARSPPRSGGTKALSRSAHLRALQIEQRRQPPVDPSEQKVHGCRRTPRRNGARRAPPRLRRRPAAPPRSRLLRALLGCRRPGAARLSGGKGVPLRGVRLHPSIRRPPLLLLLLPVGAPQGRALAPRPPRRRRPAPAAGQSELHSGHRGEERHPRRARSGLRALTHAEVCGEKFQCISFPARTPTPPHLASSSSSSRRRLLLLLLPPPAGGDGWKGLSPPPLGRPPL